MRAEADRGTVDLTVKPGEQIDTTDIESCLAHTAQQAEPEKTDLGR